MARSVLNRTHYMTTKNKLGCLAHILNTLEEPRLLFHFTPIPMFPPRLCSIKLQAVQLRLVTPLSLHRKLLEEIMTL